jgi:hypothetical protein
LLDNGRYGVFAINVEHPRKRAEMQFSSGSPFCSRIWLSVKFASSSVSEILTLLGVKLLQHAFRITEHQPSSGPFDIQIRL